jgi:homoserine kinase type II
LNRHERDSFTPEELAVVLSHFDLGPIESVTEFKRGSRRSPKVGIVAQRGKFLLKKRDRTRGGLQRVRYAHRIQRHLAAKNFPLPQLISPIDSPSVENGDDTLLVLDGEIYELFEFVAGHAYAGTAAESRDAGRALARFHQAMMDFPLDTAQESTGYHDAVAVQTGLNAIPQRLSAHDSVAGAEAELIALAVNLYEAYTEAAEAVERAGYEDWPLSVVHSDWHPGNLLFKRDAVAAVIDYDCAKIGKAISDVANGVLHFSIVAKGAPDAWPDHLDTARVAQFLSGYQEINALPAAQRTVLPQLMIEALIAESVLPIAATGSFGQFDGFGFMRMVRRKVEWIQGNIKAETGET